MLLVAFILVLQESSRQQVFHLKKSWIPPPNQMVEGICTFVETLTCCLSMPNLLLLEKSILSYVFGMVQPHMLIVAPVELRCAISFPSKEDLALKQKIASCIISITLA